MARDREGRRRPFGFVLYKHAEAVPYAIALLNGISLYGRPLKLDFSTGKAKSNNHILSGAAERHFGCSFVLNHTEGGSLLVYCSHAIFMLTVCLAD